MPRPVLLMISSMRGGGSERQTLMLLRHLDRSRFTPHLYLTERDGDLLAEVPDDVVIHCYGDTAQKSSGLYFPGRELRRQIRHVRQVLAHAAIEVVYDRTFHMTMIAGPAALDLGIPRVSTIVSPPHHALPHVEKRFVRLKKMRLAKAYRSAKCVLAVSHQAAKSAEEYYGLARDCVGVIANPVDSDSLRRLAQADAPLRDDRPTIVCVGRMTEEKGQRDLMTAVAMTEPDWPSGLPTMKVWMIGDGPQHSDLVRRWESSPHRHDVEFLGALSNPAPAIARADALVLPSHFEGMPNVVLEAMALGTPVIATRAGGTVELQHDEPTILWAQVANAKSLAEAILQFVVDRPAAAKRAEAATRMISQCHDVRRTTRAIEERLLAACV